MALPGLLHTSILEEGRSVESSAVGLVHGRTGVPALLLGLLEIEAPKQWRFLSLDQAQAVGMQFTQASDRKAWENVLGFFECGGFDITVLATPLHKNAKHAIKDLIGVDRGPGRRSGIAMFTDVAHKADLFLLPQLTEFTEDSRSLAKVWVELSRFASNMTGPFWLLDAPLRLDWNEFPKTVQNIDFADAALFYPWLRVRESLVAPSCAVAAFIQQTDKEIGVQELPSNRGGTQTAVPVKTLTPEEMRLCRKNRIGALYQQDSMCRLWASDSLSLNANPTHRVFSTRRTVQAIRVALEEICEPYVLEPITSDLPVLLETRLGNFFHSIRGALSKEGTPYEVGVELSETSAEPVLDVSVRVQLPRTLEKVEMWMQLEHK